MVNNTKSNTIIIGYLQVKEMAQSEIGKINYGSKLNRSTQNQGYLSRFVGFLTYKAKKVGKRVIEINERGTSKRCYVCGKKHDIPLWKRTMECECGNVIDRNRNSAINIMIDFLSQYGLWTTYNNELTAMCCFVDNLRKTGLLVPTWIKSPIGTNGTLVGSRPQRSALAESDGRERSDRRL